MARDVWLDDVIESVENIPIPPEKLIILGGDDDYRHWTYYLPESRSIWTKYLLYNPIRENTTVWISQNRLQEKVSPQISEINGQLEASFPLDESEGIVVFPDEMELFTGTGMIMPIMSDEEVEDEEPLCYLISTAGESEIVFTEGAWRLE